MGNIDRIVNVDIFLETITHIDTELFDLPLVITVHKKFLDRYKSYSNANQLLTDGFDITSDEYKIAANLFRYSPSISHFYLGRRHSSYISLEVVDVKDDTEYFVKVNDNVYTHNSGTGATAESIALGLVAAVNAGAGDPIVDASHTGGNIYVLNAKTGQEDTPYTVDFDDRQIIESMNSTETIVESVEAIKDEVNDWYVIMENSRFKPDVITLAQWCENEHKLFLTASNEAEIINETPAADTTSLAAILRQSKYRYTACLYHSHLGEFIEASWAGQCLRDAPGAVNWANKTLIGITVDNLTEQQRENALGKRCNVYEKVGGVGIVRDGTVFDDIYRYVDIVRDLDYLKSLIETELFRLLIDNQKIPYTDAGIAIIEAELKHQLGEAVRMGILAADPAPKTSVPLAADVPAQDKVDRILRNVNFEGTLANAINSIKILGNIIY